MSAYDAFAAWETRPVRREAESRWSRLMALGHIIRRRRVGMELSFVPRVETLDDLRPGDVVVTRDKTTGEERRWTVRP